jgi:hypothetical protein
MNIINEDSIKKALLYINYDSKKTLSENYQASLLLEQEVSYEGPYYPIPIVPGNSEKAGYGRWNYDISAGHHFKSGSVGSKFTVNGTTTDSEGQNVVVVRANDLGIKFRYNCKDNTKDSYRFKFKQGDIYSKGRWNKNCCTKVQDWNIDYWNDDDGTDNWAIKDLGPLLYRDYCQAPEKNSEKVIDYTKKKTKTGGGGTGWNKACKGTYYVGCESTVVGQAQKCLKDQGLYTALVDNKFGKGTKDGIRKKLGKDTFTDSDLQTICNTTQGGGGTPTPTPTPTETLDFDRDMNTVSVGQNKQDTTWTGDIY